ncbi:hypothetical protein PsorP6_002873 [Peronosclerospora sorghi]|uniref:Uncharacterized protein n=1 Tax=Peronosclerospora sorghi TaxID=230839 RepID=A0ACC0VN34_9STRA|nr:hypothetical protein PsorP6_002873 [Peronosclerospora sorghi]
MKGIICLYVVRWILQGCNGRLNNLFALLPTTPVLKMRVVSTLVLSSVALHAWLETIAEAASAVNETSNNRVTENKHENHVQELERDVETPDDDERMVNVLKSLFPRGPSSEEIFRQIRAGIPEESDTAKKVDNVISAMKHELTRQALREKKLLIKHFVKSWGDDVVAMALVKARNSKDGHVVVTAKTLSRQLMAYWRKDCRGSEYVLFNKLKLNQDREHLGFTDGRMAVLDEFITFRHKKAPDKELTRQLQIYFGSDKKLAWYYRGVTASDAGTSQGNEVKQRFVWTMARESDRKCRFVRLELPTGAVEQLEMERNLDLYAVPQEGDKMVEDFNKLIELFGTVNNFAELVLRAKKDTSWFLSAGKYYEEVLLQGLKHQGFAVSRVGEIFSTNSESTDLDLLHLQWELQVKYDELVGLYEDDVKVFTSRLMDEYQHSLRKEKADVEKVKDEYLTKLTEFAGGDRQVAELIIKAIDRGEPFRKKAEEFMRPLFKRLFAKDIGHETFAPVGDSYMTRKNFYDDYGAYIQNRPRQTKS